MDKEELIKKWLNNDLSDKEREAFLSLDDASFYEKIIKDSGQFKASHFVEAPSYNEFKASLDGRKKSNPSTRSLILKIAATIIVGSLLLYPILSSSSIDVKSGSTSIVHTLPDKSVVELNTNSSISYNEDSWNANRSLNLTGEAFFDVEKGSQFSVNTTLGQITVLGTEFNVKSTQDSFEIICYEGKVKVTSNAQETILTPGKGVLIENGMKIDFDILVEEPQWLRQRSVFKSEPLSNVFSELENQFNVKTSSQESNSSILFTGSFTHKNLETALQEITKPLNLTYTISDGVVTITSINE